MRYSHHPMARAGQEEERPGEEPEGIRYFDFSDPFEPVEDDADPFASEAPSPRDAADAASEASHTALKPPRPAGECGAPPSRDVFEFALANLSASPAAIPEAEEPPRRARVAFATLASFFEAEERLAEPRAQFAAAFDAARAEPERPFLAVALRMPVDVPAASHFPLVEEAICSAMQGDDALLADFERRRLVAVLRERGADAARPLFAHLMAYLREHAPNAEDVGRHIAVLAAPDGRPFQRAADFLAAAYDGP